MKICVVGGGNLGHYIVAKLGNQHEVSVLTREASEWSEIIVAEDISGKVFSGKVCEVSENPESVLVGRELIFVTWPTHIVAEKMCTIEKYIEAGTMICFCPGYGGKEFICKNLINKGVIVLGTQRVFSSTKILERGKRVQCIDNRPYVQIAVIPASESQICKTLIEDLFQKPCIVYENYLNITFTPSNPVLHTSRLYSLFKEHKAGQVYEEHFAFYSNWSEKASEVLIKCDDELQEICTELSLIDTSGVKSLKEHYEIAFVDAENDVCRMTKKIRSLKFLKDFAPMIKCETGYMIDLSARYFKEDFAYGLNVIANFAQILGVDTPQMNEILSWYTKIMNIANLEDENKFLPTKMGICTKENIYDFYLR